MNAIYTIVWNHATGCFKVVAEIAKGRSKNKTIEAGSAFGQLHGTSCSFTKLGSNTLTLSGSNSLCLKQYSQQRNVCSEKQCCFCAKRELYRQ